MAAPTDQRFPIREGDEVIPPPVRGRGAGRRVKGRGAGEVAPVLRVGLRVVPHAVEVIA